MADVEFEDIKTELVDFGNNNFIEVARKRAITDEGKNEFVAVSRGFYAPDGSKRFKKSFTIPDESKVVDFVAEKIKEMHDIDEGKPALSEKESEETEESEEEPAAEETKVEE